MHMRIIFGRLNPGAWAAYENACKEVLENAGPIPGLRARWLTRDDSDPDAGYSISLWRDLASVRAYESSPLLTDDIRARLSPFFSGVYTTTNSELRWHKVFD